MRRIVPIQDLLDRLAKLESAIGKLDSDEPIQVTAKTESPEPPAEKHFEKKTLESDSVPKDVPFPTGNEEIVNAGPEIIEEEPTEKPQVDESPSETLSLREKIGKSLANRGSDFKQPDAAENSGFNLDPNSMPIKSAPLSEEELEHVEDEKLDKEYESRLLREGDTLQIPVNPDLILGNSTKKEDDLKPRELPSLPSENTPVATATAPAKDNKALEIVSKLQEVEEIDESIPTLAENPTKDDLFKYAENHPKVKKVMRVFRGKIVEVKKS